MVHSKAEQKTVACVLKQPKIKEIKTVYRQFCLFNKSRTNLQPSDAFSWLYKYTKNVFVVAPHPAGENAPIVPVDLPSISFPFATKGKERKGEGKSKGRKE